MDFFNDQDKKNFYQEQAEPDLVLFIFSTIHIYTIHITHWEWSSLELY